MSTEICKSGNRRILVVVNIVFEGVHNWPECPHEDVSFLRYPHRHTFHIRAEKEVVHSDRDVEIIRLKRKIIEGLVVEFPLGNLGRMSCEDLCFHLIGRHTLHACEVLEDGENGAKVEWKN